MLHTHYKLIISVVVFIYHTYPSYLTQYTGIQMCHTQLEINVTANEVTFDNVKIFPFKNYVREECVWPSNV